MHLTRLRDFKPLTAGRPRIEFTPEAGGAPTVLRGLRAVAAWRVPRRRRAAGARDAIDGRSSVDAPGLTDRHDLGIVTVFADEKAAIADAGKRAGRTIPPRSPI